MSSYGVWRIQWGSASRHGLLDTVKRHMECALHGLRALDFRFWGETKGSLLKGSFNKACALTCHFLCRSLPHPPASPSLSRFPLFSTGKPRPTTHLNPTPNRSPRDNSKNSHPFAKTTPGKNYPLVSAWSLRKKLKSCLKLRVRHCERVPVNIF